MTGRAVIRLDFSRSQEHRDFQLTFFIKNLKLGFSRSLDDIQMAAGTGDTGIFEHQVGNRFITGCLNGLFGQLVTEFAPAPLLIDFDIGEMTLVAGRFGYLEFLFVRFVLVAGDTI